MLVMRLSLVALALALGAAACGGSIGADSVALDDFEPELRDAACAYLVACEQMPDRATCLAVGLGDSSELATLKADVAAGTLTYDGQAARACIDVFKRFASCKATQIGDPQSGVAWEDTLTYLNNLGLAVQDRRAVVELNARRVYLRLHRRLAGVVS